MSRAAIVTGSDSGIGRATAIALAGDGFDVGITWHTDEEGARLTAEAVRGAGAGAHVRRLDLADDPGRCIDALAADLGGLWALVNCAGANRRAALLDEDPAGWRAAIEIGLTGPVLCAQAAARLLVAAGAGGRIVNVTSVHEHDPLRHAAAYSAAKAGLGMATQVMALELAPHRITANAVAPGHIATPMTGRAGVDPESVALPADPARPPGRAGGGRGADRPPRVRRGRLRHGRLAPRRRRPAPHRRAAAPGRRRGNAGMTAGALSSRDRGLELGLRVVQAGPVLILGLLAVAMTLLSPYFLTERNLTNLGFQTSVVAVLALGQLLVILTRGIDLSVGSVVALAGVLGVIAGDSGPLVLVTMVLAGALVGAVNGLVLVKGRVMNPFIVTLGTLSIVRGAALVVSDAQTVSGLPPLVVSFGTDRVGPVPLPALLVAALAGATWVLLTKTQWGRWIYAVGGDPEAARKVGIPVDRLLISVYVLCGAAAGIAGLLVAGRTDAGSPNAGQLLELDSITAVIIGGASFFGGRGNVGNVVAGALIIGVIRNGLNLLDVTPFWQSIAIGTLVIVSLELDVLRGHLERRMRVAQARSVER